MRGDFQDKDFTGRLVLAPNGDPDWDWWTIERADHDGSHGLEPLGDIGLAFTYSGRITNADVEGNSDEMKAIAEAILRGESESFRRCAAYKQGDHYLFNSPRNSMYSARVPMAEARRFAEAALQKLAKHAEESP